jgi:hypothetical protein
MQKTRFIVPVAAAVEVATGLSILIIPRLFVLLLLGAAVAQPGVVIARICGLALLSLGLACWPGKQAPIGQQGAALVRALLTYNALLAPYLVYLRILSGYRGVLLVPAIILHIVLTILLIRHYAAVIARNP